MGACGIGNGSSLLQEGTGKGGGGTVDVEK